jgi:hypothetical protein
MSAEPSLRARARIGLVTGCALLAIATSADAQQAPALTHSSRLLRGTRAECEQRAEAVFRAEGLTVGHTGQYWAMGLRAPFHVDVDCLAAADGNTWATLFVAGNASGLAVEALRDRLIRAIESPLTQTSAAPGLIRATNTGGDTRKVCGHTVSRAVFDKWQQMEGENGLLGCAYSDEREAKDSPTGTVGTVVTFSKPGGAIYHATAGRHMGEVHEVHGLIGQKYGELGGSGSWLGFPISDETPHSVGRQSSFEGGYIIYNRLRGTTTAFPRGR